MSKKTVAAIVKSGNDYIIEVKGNQPTLLAQVKKNVAIGIPESKHKSEEKNRGRVERRETYVYPITKGIDAQWIGINKLVKVIRSGTRGKKSYLETHFFISSLNCNKAELYSKAIRSHWGIENNLHYVKDVNMNEDKSGIKGGSSAENLSIFKNIAINIYRRNGLQSIKYATRRFINRVDEQMKLIRNIHIRNKHMCNN